MRNARASAAAPAEARGAQRVDPGRAARVEIGPAPVGAVQLPATVSAADHCSVLLAFHAAAVSRNLDCVFASVDPEGPHQLRIALRRLRVVLRAFEPVMRRSAVTELRLDARKFGAIVGELRDADVMIDEIIAPEAADQPALLAALDAWRQEVRGRARARLIAADAAAFARRLAAASATYDWRKKNSSAQTAAAADLLDALIARVWAQAAPAVSSLLDHQPAQVHDLRKDVKALRYAAEIGGGLGREDHRNLAKSLKRVQDSLGYVNDVDTLKRFAPALVAESEAVSRLCKRLVSERAYAVRDCLASAQAALHEICESYAFGQRDAATSGVA